jgi:hypothetical protein
MNRALEIRERLQPEGIFTAKRCSVGRPVCRDNTSDKPCVIERRHRGDGGGSGNPFRPPMAAPPEIVRQVTPFSPGQQGVPRCDCLITLLDGPITLIERPAQQRDSTMKLERNHGSLLATRQSLPARLLRLDLARMYDPLADSAIGTKVHVMTSPRVSLTGRNVR